jgi:hypothetical protein
MKTTVAVPSLEVSAEKSPHSISRFVKKGHCGAQEALHWPEVSFEHAV